LKNIWHLLWLLPLCGCANISVPNYVKDVHPYKRLFYVPFEDVRDAAERTLGDFGWTIARESDPALFEMDRTSGHGGPQTLMFTEIRQTSFFIGSKYTRLNAFLRVLPDGATEVEMRYLGVSNIVFRKSYDYRNDKAMRRILDKIEEKVK